MAAETKSGPVRVAATRVAAATGPATGTKAIRTRRRARLLWLTSGALVALVVLIGYRFRSSWLPARLAGVGSANQPIDSSASADHAFTDAGGVKTPGLKIERISLSEGTHAGQAWDGNSLTMKFCWCPPGRFTMGSSGADPKRGSDEGPVDVTLTRGFWLGKHEVTQSQDAALVPDHRNHFSKDGVGADKVVGVDASVLPADSISWEAATAFCRRLTERERAAGRLPATWEYRLPTEAQWEHACRAKTETRYACGDDESTLLDYAWYGANSGERTHEVGQKLPNAWGLHDMHGNVGEWCRDGRGPLVGGTDPEATVGMTNRVLRGGSWLFDGGRCRSAYRGGNKPASQHYSNGFRVAIVSAESKTKE